MSKKDVSAMISAAGWISSLVDGLYKDLVLKGATAEEIHSLVTGSGVLPIGVIGDALIKEIRLSRLKKDNVISLGFVTSDGTFGKGWIERFEKKGFIISDSAKRILLSPDFKPTNGVMTEIVVIKGEFFSDENRITKNIHAEAERSNLSKPNMEVACLIREKFTDKEIDALGLWCIVTMHESFKDSDGRQRLLLAYQNDNVSWLETHYDNPIDRWNCGVGFAFTVQ